MTSAAPPVATVVIPARDAAATIGRCVLAVRAQVDGAGRGVRVIVVDDGSRDETGRVAAEAGAEVLTAAGDGPARARNLGTRAATTPLIIFTDADCAPREGFVAALLAPFDDPEVAGTKGVYETEQRGWVARFVQQEYEERYRRMARRARIDFIDTYAAAYRREVLLEVGGFDERYRLPSTEDQELSFRIAATGRRLVFAPGARVGHLHADTLWRYARKKAKIGTYKVATLRRHPGKVRDDAHTPSSLKLQLCLLPLVCAGVPAAALGELARAGWSLPAAGALVAWGRWGLLPLATFLLTLLPLCVHVARADPALLLVTPPLVLVRAAALAVGVALGALRELRGGVLPAAAMGGT